MLLGAVADDFTGATDLATALHGRGLRVAVVIEDRPVDAARLSGLDAVVVALKTRTAPVVDAVARSVAAVSWLRSVGAERFYVKYCSTFDSTDDGNIGPVLDAVRQQLGVDRAVVVPAFPANGRTVYRGHLFVGGDLLEHSSMRHHPLTPMTRSRLRDLLAPQTVAPITEIPLSVVRHGVDALRVALDGAEPGHLVVDAIDDSDLVAIARATAAHRLVSGGAGLALGFEGTPRDGGDVTSGPASFPTFTGRRLVVCGSASAATRAQIADAATSHPTRKVDLSAAVADPEAEAAALAAWVRGLDPDTEPVVYSVGELADVDPSGGHGSASADAVERVLSSLVRDLVTTGDPGAAVDQVIVAGGETSGAVVTALGVSALTIGPALAPGVCWSAATTDTGRDVAIVLKSGNFGALDLFSSAWGVIS
ncbi:3-oxo-tetronate kinase [Frigoribacterium sp. 2-23]|uniref:3-oxo-tetronate kinase n=1 Tax=Frigoribacterium sp. 2-23 TaxID=3415006 RepID=UPI003C6F0790